MLSVKNIKIFEKLHIIEGDLNRKGLGLNEKEKETLSNVKIVFHTAASVRFDEPLKVKKNIISFEFFIYSIFIIRMLSCQV